MAIPRQVPRCAYGLAAAHQMLCTCRCFGWMGCPELQPIIALRLGLFLFWQHDPKMVWSGSISLRVGDVAQYVLYRHNIEDISVALFF